MVLVIIGSLCHSPELDIAGRESTGRGWCGGAADTWLRAGEGRGRDRKSGQCGPICMGRDRRKTDKRRCLTHPVHIFTEGNSSGTPERDGKTLTDCMAPLDAGRGRCFYREVLHGGLGDGSRRWGCSIFLRFKPSPDAGSGPTGVG